jgi:hypothetical protein
LVISSSPRVVVRRGNIKFLTLLLDAPDGTKSRLLHSYHSRRGRLTSTSFYEFLTKTSHLDRLIMKRDLDTAKTLELMHGPLRLNLLRAETFKFSLLSVESLFSLPKSLQLFRGNVCRSRLSTKPFQFRSLVLKLFFDGVQTTKFHRGSITMTLKSQVRVLDRLHLGNGLVVQGLPVNARGRSATCLNAHRRKRWWQGCGIGRQATMFVGTSDVVE